MQREHSLGRPDDVQAVEILEHVSRNSIMIFLELLEKYESRDIIHRSIETAIFDSEAKSKISHVIEFSEYIDLKFLEKLTWYIEICSVYHTM